MPPKTTSTRSCSTSFAASAAATASSVALSSRNSSSVPPEQAALGVDVADDHPGDVGVGEPDERERAGLVGDDAHLDRVAAAVELPHDLLPWRGARCRLAGRDRQRARGVHDAAPPSRPIHRENTPSWTPPLRLAEFVATLALAQDNAFGQPLESQLRSCLLASWICEAAGFDQEVRDDAYWVALLRYVGCTGHAHEVATVFGDEIAIRAQTLVHDAANPTEVMGDVVAFATAGRSDEERDEIVRMLQETAHEWAVHNFTSGCEVADMLVAAARLRPRRPRGAGASRSSAGTARASRPTRAARRSRSPMRVVHLSHDMEAIGRIFSPERAARGRPRSPRPHVRPGARGPVRRARRAPGSTGSREIEPWDAVLALEPEPRRMLDGRGARRGADGRRRLHRPEVAVHGRAQPPLRAARRPTPPGCSGSPEEAVTDAPPGGARARLRHHRGAELDLGQAGPAHAHGVRPRRAPPDADRADAPPLAGARRAEPGRVRAPREVRRLRLPQARAGRHRATRRHACWPRPRSTSG